MINLIKGNMKTTFLMVGDNEIEYFLNQGWEIVSTAPKPFPCPYIYFCVKKDHENILTKQERKDLHDNCWKYGNELI